MNVEPYTRAVVEYIHHHISLRNQNVVACTYNGKPALIANTPYLTELLRYCSEASDMYKETLGVTFCLQADRSYRVAVCTMNGRDPGPEYGELYGRYRIAIYPELVMLSGCDMKKDVFQ